MATKEPRVGDFSMWLCLGALIPGNPRVALYRKPGHAGTGSHHGPADAMPQPLRTLAVVEGADAAQTLWEGYQALARGGDVHDVVDGLGIEWSSVRVLGVMPAIVRAAGLQPWSPAMGMSSQPGDHVVMVDWLILLSEETGA